MGWRKPRRPNLTDEQKDAIRAYHTANPRLYYHQIAAHFDVGVTSVFIAINGSQYKTTPKPKPAPEAKQTMALPPSCSVKQPESIISPIPLSLLMAGRGPRAKLRAA